MSLYPTSFVAIDFETAYSPRLSVCSVGLVKYIDNRAVDEYYSLVQPPWDAIPESSMSNRNIHGIYDRDLIDKEFWPEIHRNMEIFCEGLPLVAHNASFEKSCINKCNEHYKITDTQLCYRDMLDTLAITKRIEPLFGISLSGPGARRLNTLCIMYQCPMSGMHHNALDDSYGCGDLLVKFNQILEMSPAERKSMNITVPEPIVEKHRTPGTVELLSEMFDFY